MPLVTEEDAVKLLPKLDNKFGRWLARKILQTRSIAKLNTICDSLAGEEGPDFAAAYLDNQGIDYMIGNVGYLKNLQEGPFITVSNHPYGHLDGVMLIDLFGHQRPDYKVMVNSMLSLIRPLETNFITVVPTGKSATSPMAQSLSGIRSSMDHLSKGAAMGIFPSGAVSDLSLHERCVRDRQWQDSAIRMIMRAGVPVVPVRFFDGNSAFYYSLGLISSSVRLLRLPAEALNKRGATMRLGIGKPIDVSTQKQFKSVEEFKTMLRASVYDMPLPANFTKRSQLYRDNAFVFLRDEKSV